MPFERVYGPGLHATVAALSTVGHLSVLRSYRLVTVSLYCLGPVTLFWLCYRLIGSRGYALAAGLLYSLYSPIGLLSSIARTDLGSPFWPRRFQALVEYGESPHIAALTLVPLAVWSFHEAVGMGRRRFAPLAAVLFGAVIATNWTATVGLSMAFAAYAVSQAGGVPRQRWLEAGAIGIVGYLLVCRLVPPSVLAAVPGNASNSDGTHFGMVPGAGMVLLAGMLTALHFLLNRYRVPRGSRFFLYFFAISGFVVLGRFWFDIYVFPQPHRFQLELEMAFIPLCLLPFHAWWHIWTNRVRIPLLVALALFCVFQVREYRQGMDFLTRPVKMENTVEYRATKWLERNAPGERVFAPGSVSVWMNVLGDTPQMVGCCDQSIPSLSHRLAFTTIYDGHLAGSHDAEVSILWLKAYGASVVGVPGPASKEFFKSFQNPRKFEGILPVLWREDDTTLYRVPARSNSLAHVIRRESEVRRQPSRGWDVDPLRPYVAALDDASLPLVEMQWVNAHQARIGATLAADQIVSVQVSYAPGWHATANGAPVPLHGDALGLLIAEPACHGSCAIDLVYDSPPEARYAGWTQLLAAVLCIAVAFGRRSGKTHIAMGSSGDSPRTASPPSESLDCYPPLAKRQNS
jgi:hypothetical protein